MDYASIEKTNPYVKAIPLPEHHRGMLFDGILTMQNRNIFAAYPALFLKEKFARIIEIGTAFGGFAVWFRKYIGMEMGLFDGPIITYDISNGPAGHDEYMVKQFSYAGYQSTDFSINDYLKNLDIDFKIKDCFEKETFKEITDLIQEPGKTLIVCDGGNKAKEVQEFSPYLKKGDIIIGHDYSKTGNPNYYLWWEIELTHDHIASSIKENNIGKHELEPLFDKAVSFIGVKE